MATVQPQWYSEGDFSRVEAQLARWRSIREADGWPDFATTVEGMLFGWERSLATLETKDVVRVQGMIAGARAILALATGKMQEKEEIIAAMQAENDSISQARTEQEEGE